MKFLKYIFVVILFTNCYINAQSDSSLNITYLGYWGDGQNRQVESLASKGNLIAVGLETYLQIVDFSNPNWPQTRGDYHLWGQGFVREIGIHENAAYLFTRNGGGKIMDISDIDNLIYVGDMSIGRFFSFDENYLVAPGCYSYIADFRIFDISVPLNPILINEFDLNQYSCKNYSIVVQNSMIFFYGHETWPSTDRYFLIIDIADPYNPDIIYSELNTTITSFTILNQLLIAMEAGGEPGIHIYDISQPSLPEEKGYYECNGWIRGAYTNYCYYVPYLPPNYDQLIMLDISDVTNPKLGGYYVSSDIDFKSGFTSISGNRIYHSNLNRVYLLVNDLISSVDEYDEIKSFKLEQNYPNPFNPTTKIEFRIADFGFVSLKVYDVLGNEIATLVNEEKPAGEYEVEFDGSRLPTGIYFYQLQAGNFVETKKMVLLK
jgi:hypothetical protein